MTISFLILEIARSRCAHCVDSNLNRKSFSDFGISYEHIDYRARETRSESILAGSYHFQTVEIEVFVAAE